MLDGELEILELGDAIGVLSLVEKDRLNKLRSFEARQVKKEIGVILWLILAAILLAQSSHL